MADNVLEMPIDSNELRGYGFGWLGSVYRFLPRFTPRQLGRSLVGSTYGRQRTVPIHVYLGELTDPDARPWHMRVVVRRLEQVFVPDRRPMGRFHPHPDYRFEAWVTDPAPLGHFEASDHGRRVQCYVLTDRRTGKPRLGLLQQVKGNFDPDGPLRMAGS